MASSDFLFRLIKSLSKGDRRNLRLFGGLQEGEKKYFLLFDAIDAQREYDEDAIILQFEGERFLNQLSVAKNYLYNYILKTLHVFHREQHAELNMLIHQVEILIGKDLHDQAYKQIRKSKQIALNQERFLELSSLLALQRRVIRHTDAFSDQPGILDKIKAEEAKALSHFTEIQSYMQLWDDVEVTIKPVGNRVTTPEWYRDLLKHELFSENRQVATKKAQIAKYSAKGLIHTCLQEKAEALEAYQQAIALYQSSEEIRIEWNVRHLAALGEVCSLAIGLGDYNLATEALQKLNAAEIYCHEEHLRRFERHAYLSISLCLLKGDKKGGMQAIASFEAEAKELGWEFDKTMQIGISFMVAYFLLAVGEHGKCIKWVKRILNEPRAEKPIEVLCMARILSILVHYELEHFDMIEYLSKSASRFFQNRREMTKLETLSLKYLRNLGDIGGEEGEKAMLVAFDKEIAALVQADKSEQFALDLLDLRTWLSARQKHSRLIDKYKSMNK